MGADKLLLREAHIQQEADKKQESKPTRKLMSGKS